MFGYVKWAFLAGLALTAAAAWGDAVKVGANTYENVYVSETPSKYIVCFPCDGNMIDIAKSEVSPENLRITQDREERRSLYEQWLAKRKEQQGYSTTSSESPSHEDIEKASASSASGADESEDSPVAKKTLRRSGGPSGSYGAGAYSSQNTPDDCNKGQRQANIAAQRRQREMAKLRAFTNRTVITSESARGGGGVQWNNTVQWNNSGGQFSSGNY